MGISQTPQAIVPAAFTSGSMTLLSTTTLSGTSVTLSSIPQTYNNLLIVLSNVNFGTGTTQIQIIPNNTTEFAGVCSIGGPSVTASNVSISSQIKTGQNWNQNDNNSFTILIDNYTSTTIYKNVSGQGYANTSAGQMGFSLGGSWRDKTNPITSLVIKTGDSYTFNSGTVLLYGVK